MTDNLLKTVFIIFYIMYISIIAVCISIANLFPFFKWISAWLESHTVQFCFAAIFISLPLLLFQVDNCQWLVQLTHCQ